MKVDIEEYIQDEKHREKMDTATKPEKGHGRTETRTAFTTNDVSWMSGGREWPGLRCIGAIKTHFLPPLDKMRNNTVFFLMETILRHLWRQQRGGDQLPVHGTGAPAKGGRQHDKDSRGEHRPP